MSRLAKQPAIEMAHDLKCLAIRFLFGEISRADYQKEFYRLVQNLEHANSQHTVLARGRKFVLRRVDK